MKAQRSTKQRKMILETVRADGNHPTADQIYLHVRGEDQKISRGTVYRNLNLLADNGEIRHVVMPDADRFDWRMEPHYHLRCVRCGKVSDAPVPYSAELDRQISEQTGYGMVEHLTVFEGLCPDCRQKEEEDLPK